MDHDKKGKLTAKDVCDVMRRFGEKLTETDAETLIKQVDTEGKGHVTKEGQLYQFNNRMMLEKMS